MIIISMNENSSYNCLPTTTQNYMHTTANNTACFTNDYPISAITEDFTEYF